MSAKIKTAGPRDRDEISTLIGEQLEIQWDRDSQGALVDEALDKIDHQIKQGDMKGSMMDLVRLIQLHREMEFQQPTEVEVTWVEPLKEEDAVKT